MNVVGDESIKPSRVKAAVISIIKESDDGY